MNDLDRGIGTYPYGRRTYETMLSWESTSDNEQPEGARDFAQIWRAADKVVFSRTLGAPWSARTRIERRFEPQAVRRMKEAAPRDLSVGGAELAGQALAAGLVDECHLFLNPVLVGAGQLWLPAKLRSARDWRHAHVRRRPDCRFHVRAALVRTLLDREPERFLTRVLRKEPAL